MTSCLVVALETPADLAFVEAMAQRAQPLGPIFGVLARDLARQYRAGLPRLASTTVTLSNRSQAMGLLSLAMGPHPAPGVVPWLQYPGRLVTVPGGKAAPIRDFQRQVTHWGLEPARRQDELW